MARVRYFKFSYNIKKYSFKYWFSFSTHSRTHIDDHNKGFYELKKKKDLLQTERNDLCRKEMNLQQSLSALKEELAKAEQTLRSMAGKPILNGRDSVKKVLQIFRDKGGQYAKTGSSFWLLFFHQKFCQIAMVTDLMLLFDDFFWFFFQPPCITDWSLKISNVNRAFIQLLKLRQEIDFFIILLKKILWVLWSSKRWTSKNFLAKLLSCHSTG